MIWRCQMCGRQSAFDRRYTGFRWLVTREDSLRHARPVSRSPGKHQANEFAPEVSALGRGQRALARNELAPSQAAFDPCLKGPGCCCLHRRFGMSKDSSSRL
jgi:hypothetical protein